MDVQAIFLNMIEIILAHLQILLLIVGIVRRLYAIGLPGY